MDKSVVKSLGELEIPSEAEAYESYVNAALEDGQTEHLFVQRSYATILTEADIRELMESDIQSVSDFTFLSKAEATLLLSHLSWDVNDIREQWSAGAQSVRETVGLLDLDPPSDDNEFICGVCGESHPPEKFAWVSCGHLICSFCWNMFIGHINKIINEKPAAEWNLWLKCPAIVSRYASCSASVGRDMIERFAFRANKSKYDQYILRSYVDNSKTMKWHPVRGSSGAIDLGPASGNPDVSCLRLLRFCWNCRENAHSPVDCITAANWLEMAESVADKYKDCYENWKSNDSLMQAAEANLPRLDTAIQDLSNTQLANVAQLQFILEAGLQIIECTRFLKWTYAYGYYLEEDEVRKQNLLKQTQADVKLLLGKLDDCVKTELPPFVNAEGPSENFNVFRIKLTELTSTTRKHNENLVRVLDMA